MDFRKYGQDVSILFIGRKRDGVIYTPDAPDWEWLSGCLRDIPFTLHGVYCRVLSIEQLLHEKLVYESGTGRSPREKDLKSIQLLETLLRKNELGWGEFNVHKTR